LLLSILKDFKSSLSLSVMIPDIIGLAPQHQGLMVRFGASNHQIAGTRPGPEEKAEGGRQKAEGGMKLLPAACCPLPAAHCLFDLPARGETEIILRSKKDVKKTKA